MVAMFDPNEAKSIRESRELMDKDSLLNDLAFIKCHLSFLPVSIKKLEESGLTLVESTDIVSKVVKKIQDIPVTKGKIQYACG